MTSDQDNYLGERLAIMRTEDVICYNTDNYPSFHRLNDDADFQTTLIFRKL